MNDSGPCSILIVDDEPNLATTIGKILERAGYTVTCAGNGRQALQLLGEQAFDVVITDILMPDLDGNEIIAATRRIQPQARIVAMSGGGIYMSSPDVLSMAKRLGANAGVMKPFTPAQLLAAIRVPLAPS